MLAGAMDDHGGAGRRGLRRRWVLTQTAAVLAAAWREIFDAYLRDRAARAGERFVAFDRVGDYDEYVDGEPRHEDVVGVDRAGQGAALRDHGADIVVSDLAELLDAP